jgi:hypothetical protein
MNATKFENIVYDQQKLCTDILFRKAGEYATEDDRLHNFKVAASLQSVPLTHACAGMMAKHTVSIFDMCYDGKTYSIEQWEEKITDHINYLLLLKAIVQEDLEQYASPSVKPTVYRSQAPVSPSELELD